MDRDGNRVEIAELPQLNGIEVNPGNVPVLVSDPQIHTAYGRFAYGFNLNGEVEPDAFENPDSGERGVDNRMWRALGCFEVYQIRRPVRPYNEGHRLGHGAGCDAGVADVGLRPGSGQ